MGWRMRIVREQGDKTWDMRHPFCFGHGLEVQMRLTRGLSTELEDLILLRDRITSEVKVRE